MLMVNMSMSMSSHPSPALMSSEMCSNVAWNPRLIFVSNLKTNNNRSTSTKTTTENQQQTKMSRNSNNWSCSRRNRHKSRTIPTRIIPNDCTRVISLLISVCFVSLLFCYGVTDGRPQTQQLSAGGGRNYLDDESSVKSQDAFSATFINSFDTSGTRVEGSTSTVNQATNHQLTPDLLKLREVMLMELGLMEAARNASYQLPQVEISREEYIRAYTEYMSKVRSRRTAEKAGIDSLTLRERRKKFRKTVQFFDNLNKETNRTTFDSEKDSTFERQLMFDINFSHYYDTSEVRVREATLYLPTGCYLWDSSKNNNNNAAKRVDQLDITSNVTYWINHAKGSDHHAFTLTAECERSTGASSEGSSNGYIKVIAKLASKEELRNRRSKRALAQEKFLGVRDLLNRGKARECSDLRHGKACCRTSLRVEFEELGIKDLIFEPKGFDAHMCSGRCNANAKRVAYASTHALIQQTLHKSFGKKKAQKPCCAPMELGALDVIHTVPGQHRLEVTTIHDAIVLRCGCS